MLLSDGSVNTIDFGNCDFATDLYISSWDIKRAFDSLGPEYVIRSLQRLHIPRDIAEYLVNMDNTGQVYVRTPLNAKIKE